MVPRQDPASPNAPSLLDTLRALEPPRDAHGAARAKGLGADETVEAFLGCGFPQMVVTTAAPAEEVELATFLARYRRSRS